jgi:hypothetical protein
MFEGFPQKSTIPENRVPPTTEKHTVSREWEIEDERGNVETEELQEEVESEEVAKGAEELLKRFGGFISLRESIKYALASPEQMESLATAIQEREQRYEQGLTIENYGKLEI